MASAFLSLCQSQRLLPSSFSSPAKFALTTCSISQSLSTRSISPYLSTCSISPSLFFEQFFSLFHKHSPLCSSSSSITPKLFSFPHYSILSFPLCFDPFSFCLFVRLSLFVSLSVSLVLSLCPSLSFCLSLCLFFLFVSLSISHYIYR